MTRLSCIAGRHAAGPRQTRNQGFAFAGCRNCGCDLVRSRSAWKAVPKGFRVVWRRAAAPQVEISAAQFLLDLPAVDRALALAASPPRPRGRASVLFEVAAAGLRCLVWAAADRLRAWRRALRAPRTAAQPVLRLPAL